MTLANLITCVRILLLPLFGYLWWRGHHAAALSVFAVAAFTDWLDGFVARVLDQKTALGQLLDPAADKLMVLVVFLVAAARHAIPTWLAVLVIGRDVVLATGGALFAFVLRGRLGPERWKPSRLGKYATFTQLSTIGLALAYDVTEWQALRPYVAAVGVTCAALTVVAGLQYVSFGVRALARGRVAT